MCEKLIGALINHWPIVIKSSTGRYCASFHAAVTRRSGRRRVVESIASEISRGFPAGAFSRPAENPAPVLGVFSTGHYLLYTTSVPGARMGKLKQQGQHMT